MPSLPIAANGESSQTQRISYFEAHSPQIGFGWDKIEGVRSDLWKFAAWPPPEELYDGIADPNEERNVAAQHENIVDDLRWQHEEILSAAGVDAYATTQIDLDPTQAAQLAALGYIEAVAAFAEGNVGSPPLY